MNRPITHIIAVLLAGSAPALAQDANGVAFSLGVGPQSAPLYFGSDQTDVGVTGDFAFGSLRLSGRCFGCGDGYGLGVTGSFRYIGARDDYMDILSDRGAGAPAYTFDAVDAAIEVGGGLKYAAPDYEVYGALRRGFGGHDGLVAELGGDYILQAGDALNIRVGPRLLAGDDDFMQTYFDAGAAAASGSDFTASGGPISRGVELSAVYDITDDWGLKGTLRYDQLLDDAAASPVSESDDQTTISVVVTRSVSFGF